MYRNRKGCFVYGFLCFIVFICFLRRVADGTWGICSVVRS